MTTKEIIWLLIILATIIILGLILTAEINATEIDWESLERIVPEGECAGGTIPELKKSVWYCK